MNLKTRLLLQNVGVLLCTIVITFCLGLFFWSAYSLFANLPDGGEAGPETVVLRDGLVLDKPKWMPVTAVQEMLLSLRQDAEFFELDGVRYQVTARQFDAPEGDRYQVITLSPFLNIQAQYRVMILFLVVAFFVVFGIASLVAQNANAKNIINPVLYLKREAEQLSWGELDREIVDMGADEVKDLARAIEALRLRLKESVYTKEKYDDNRKFLISSISHDLKTPVTAVRGYIEGILDGIADTPEKREKYLQAALSKTDLIRIMIDDLLLYSKLDLNQMPFRMEKLEIGAFLKAMAEDASITYEKEKKTVQFDNQLHEPVFVLADDVYLRRVVLNILDNARKNIQPSTGTMAIRVRQRKDAVVLEFTDNGQGIAPDDLAHIFDRFYRGDSARRIEGSSGLGLAIAKQIIQGFDGRIWAVSTLGEGTSMMVSLPKYKTEHK